ncbi:MAG: efflux RND transporter periplasmic adaptor subunit [Acidobacteriota bacterium]|nr:MAG: efflux RND transporter periplasmic adaptor subunit [Acidobacteriota bacterium]
MTLNEISQAGPGQWNRGRLLMVLGVIVVLAAAIVGLMKWRKAEPASANAVAEATVEPPVDVMTVAAITRGLQRSVEAVGSLAADEEVIVAAQVAGELSQLNVDFGSYVTQGQVIAVIDQRDAKLKVEQAEATLKQTMARLGMSGMKEGERYDPGQNADVKVAKAALEWARLDLQRATQLVEKGDVARSVYDQAMINHTSAQARYQAAVDAVNQQLALVDQQRAALALARKNISDTVVRAPISGAVKEKLTSRGSYLPVNGKIVTLVRINPLRLRADIPEYAAGSVRIGQTMNLNIESFPGKTYTGRVVRIGPSLSEQTRALTVEAEVSNPGNILRPGMFAKAQLITDKDAQAVMVPASAVVNSAGLSKVFVIENGKASERIVKTGVIDGEMIEIVEGVRAGDILATSNLSRLQQGAAVSIGK